MTDGLRPYPATKETGNLWVREVPTHWDVKRMGEVGRFAKGAGGTKDDEVSDGIPCVRYGDLYTTHRFSIHASRSFVTQDRAADYTPMRYGDLLFAASGETFDEIGKSAVNLMHTESRCGGDVILLRPQIDIDPQYLGYAADSRSAVIQKASLGRGTTIKHIYPDQLKRVVIAVPPLEEQAAIVRFLDDADRRIRRSIAAKRKLIALLDEQKRALINRVACRDGDLSRGVGTDATDDGHGSTKPWQFAQLRRVVRPGTTITYGIVQAGPDVEGGIPYIRTSDMRADGLASSGYLRTSVEIDRAYARSKVVTDDLVVAIRASIGRGLLVPPALEGANLTQGTARICPGSRLRPRYLFYAFNSRYCQEQIAMFAKGTTFLEITLESLRKIVVPVPPLNEQDEIVEQLDGQLAALQAVRSAATEQVRLMSEYRTRLVSDVVTGRLDVREAVVRLPEEDAAPEVLAIDDAVEVGLLLDQDSDIGGAAAEAEA